MSVLDDKYWTDTAKFAASCLSPSNRVIVPRAFRRLLPGAIPYEQRHLCKAPEVIVLHKGMLAQLGRAWIEQATAGFYPTFANEVFIIFTKTDLRPSVANTSHFRAYVEKLDSLDVENERLKSLDGENTSVLAAGGANNRLAVALADNVALTKTIYGHKVYVDTRDLSLAPHILMDGYWEQSITDFFLTVVQPQMRVVEIGANIGWYSLLAAETIGTTGKLVSFEANPHIAELLRRNISVNGFFDRVKVVNKAVFSTTRMIEFGVYDKYIAGSSLFARAESQRQDFSYPQFDDEFRLIEVEAVTLDSYFAGGSKVDLLKIDAEGAEPHILAGAERLLTENKEVQIIMEFAPRLFERSGYSAHKLCADIQALGFQAFRIKDDSSLHEWNLSDLGNCGDHHDLILRR
jgi:FkbM family methyltransferase